MINPYEHLWMSRSMHDHILGPDIGSIAYKWTMSFAVKKLYTFVIDTMDALNAWKCKIPISYDPYIFDCVLCAVSKPINIGAFENRELFHRSQTHITGIKFSICVRDRFIRVRYLSSENAIESL